MLRALIDLLRMTPSPTRLAPAAASFGSAGPATVATVRTMPARTPLAAPAQVDRVRFSVIIPLHNKARYVRSTLDSVLAQTAVDFEVIVVDDGSTDEGPDIVAAIADPRLRLVRQANAGVSVARNLGIALARGDWVAFLDADDWHHPRYLEHLQQAHERHPEADAVACRFVTFTDGEAVSPMAWQVPAGPAPVELITDLPTRWMRGPTLFTGSVAVRRSLLQRMQPCFPPGESFGEDLDLWFRVAERTPIALVHAPLAAYRTDVGGSLSARHDVSQLPPWVERMLDRVRSGSLPDHRSRSALDYIAQLKIDMARHAVCEGRRADALRWLWSARRIMLSKRWWFTASMIVCWPGHMVRSYMMRTRRNPLQADPALRGPARAA
jgi:glycosyltransferase involved in cell wall biosynthesis